jgi:hypothetical protein
VAVARWSITTLLAGVVPAPNNSGDEAALTSLKVQILVLLVVVRGARHTKQQVEPRAPAQRARCALGTNKRKTKRRWLAYVGEHGLEDDAVQVTKRARPGGWAHVLRLALNQAAFIRHRSAADAAKAKEEQQHGPHDGICVRDGRRENFV